MKDITIENIKARLEQLTILELRQIAREVGVERPAADKREAVIKKIIAIANGTTEPVEHEKSPLDEMVDKRLVKDILAFRKSILG